MNNHYTTESSREAGQNEGWWWTTGEMQKRPRSRAESKGWGAGKRKGGKFKEVGVKQSWRSQLTSNGELRQLTLFWVRGGKQGIWRKRRRKRGKKCRRSWWRAGGNDHWERGGGTKEGSERDGVSYSDCWCIIITNNRCNLQQLLVLKWPQVNLTQTDGKLS